MLHQGIAFILRKLAAIGWTPAPVEIEAVRCFQSIVCALLTVNNNPLCVLMRKTSRLL